MAASGPIEALKERKVRRPLAAVIVYLGGMALLVLGGFLLLPALAGQVYDFVSSLPGSLSELENRAAGLAERFGVPSTRLCRGRSATS